MAYCCSEGHAFGVAAYECFWEDHQVAGVDCASRVVKRLSVSGRSNSRGAAWTTATLVMMDSMTGHGGGAETVVFINYRRSDAASEAAFLHAELSDRFGAKAVFLDYESIPLGRDYRPELLGRVRECAVLLVVVSDRWLDGEVGQRPIDDEEDWVRREILAALEQGVPVVPVLFGGGKVDPDRLPVELAVLANLQYFTVHRLQRAQIEVLGDYLVRQVPRVQDRPGRDVGGVQALVVPDGYRDVLDRLDDIQLTRRPWLDSQVEAFLAEHPRGYFFIEGKTGVGKTTFVAQFAAEHGCPHHFVSNVAARGTVTGALRSLGNQLITRYELDVDPAIAGDPIGFQTVLRAAAVVAGGREQKLVLVVDGLDQAVEHGDLPLALPVTLPDNVYVVATAREGVALYARERPYVHVRIEPGSADTGDDIRRHIDETLHADAALRALVAAKLPLDEFRDTLAQRCAGVWIYLRHALADVRAGRVAPDDLRSLPPDLWTFYSRTLNELTKASDLALPALSALACAAEPLNLDTLVALAGIENSPKRVLELRTVMTGRVRAFVNTVGDEDDRCFTPLHDSAREYLVGERPDDTMTGDEQQLDLLATTATATHRRIIERYLVALFGTAESIPEVVTTDPARLGRLDGGYGLRNLAGHLAEVGEADTLHRLLTAEHPEGNAWFRAHEAHGTFADYRASVTLARRLAAEDTDQVLAEGALAEAIAKEVRYALMEGSVESIIAGTRPELLRALVEGRVWSPRVALGRIRAVDHYATQVELVAALAEAQRPGEGCCLSGWDAWHALRLVFPPASKRAFAVAALVLARLPQDVREPIVREQLALGLSDDFPYRADVLGALGAVLAPADLERVVTAVLDLPNDPDIGSALLGLVPHLPPSELLRVHEAVKDRQPMAHKWRRVHRALALRLAEERLLPDHVTRYLTADLVMPMFRDDPTGELDDIRGLAGLVDENQRVQALNAVLDRITKPSGEVNTESLIPLGEFLLGPPLDRALGLARAIGEDRPSWVRARTLAALTQAVPEKQQPALVEEALRALPEPGSRFDLCREETLGYLAAHASGKTIAAVRKAARELAAHQLAVVLAALSGSAGTREAAALRDEAVDLAATCFGWQRATALSRMAPHLDHRTRLRALDLVSGIGYGLGLARYRADALDALVAGTRDEEELTHAARIAGWIGDLRPQADALAALTGQVSWAARAGLRARVEGLVATLPATERIDPLTVLSRHVPDEERATVLRRAADLLPVRREVGDHRFAVRLAAVRPVLTEREVHDRLAETVYLLEDEDALDVWRVLGPSLVPGRATDKFWKLLRKRMRTAPESRFARYLAMIAPVVDADEVEDLRSTASELGAPHRLLPLAAVARRLAEPDQRRLVGQLLADLRGRDALRPYPVALLAEAMTEPERDRLVDRVVGIATAWWFLDLLAELLPHLSEPQRARASLAGIAVLPQQAAMPGRDFAAVTRHASPAFLQALLAATRFAPEAQKSRAITATLGAPAVSSPSWNRNTNDLGSVRDLLSGLGRPGLLTVLAATTPTLAREGGRQATDECVAAIEDVVRWWP